MRNISFHHTQQQILDRTKTVTRRLGWRWLQAGTELRAVDKCQGLKPGEHPRELALILVQSVRVEPLLAIEGDDVAREGFAGMGQAEFILRYCRSFRILATDLVTRIEFDYLPGALALARWKGVSLFDEEVHR